MPYNYWATTTAPKSSGLHIVQRDSDDYESACTLYNRALAFRPAWIAYPYDEDEVVSAVRLAVAQQLPIAVRSGAHDYEGFSSNNGGAVIDTSHCQAITVSADHRSCVTGPGVTLRQLYHSLHRYGLSLPGGTCGSVGIAGLTLGGGVGNLGRLHGLTCDRLRQVRLVISTGDILDSEDRAIGDELLWACKGGGGGNFGIVTRFEFNPVSIPTHVTAFSYKWHWGESALRVLFRAFERWVAAAPREIAATLVLAGKPLGVFHLFGQSLLDQSSTCQSLSPVTESVAEPIEAAITTLPYLHQIEQFAGNDFTSTAWKMASSFSRDEVADECIDAIIGNLTDSPPIALIEIDALGGAISDLEPADTAFPHRRERLLWQYQTYWSNPVDATPCREWVRRIFSAVDPYTSRGSYRNYCDLNLIDWSRRYYGANYARLQHVKQLFDPQNVFRYPQSVGLTHP